MTQGQAQTDLCDSITANIWVEFFQQPAAAFCPRLAEVIFSEEEVDAEISMLDRLRVNNGEAPNA